MRPIPRTTALTRRSAAVALAAVLVLAACGGDDEQSDTTDGSDPTTASTTAGGDEPAPTTIASSAEKPEVQVPDELPTELVVTVLVAGDGPEAADGDTVVVDYVGVRSEDGTEFDNSYDRGQPFPVTLGAGGVIQGWDQGLVGAQAGSRIQLDIPADLAYGDQPQGDVIQAGDALTFVIDVRLVVPESDPADAPQLELTPSTGATEVTTEDVVVGDGPEVVEGTTAYVQLIAYRGDTLELLESSWESGGPVQLVIAEGQLIDGLREGMLGMQVGGRRIITIPDELAFGTEGNEALGLPAGTDLVMVIDVIAAY